MTWKSALNPDLLAVLLVVPERMSLINLYLFIRHLSGNQQKTDRYDIAMWKKLVYPLAALVMLALALPFAYMQDRMGAVSIRVFAGIMLGIGFHMLNGLFSSLGVINSWAPFFSAITPSVIFLLTAAGHALVGGATIAQTDLKIRRVPARRSCRELVIPVEQGPEQANAKPEQAWPRQRIAQ
jgi:lipopolysaccharide export system permease protein